MTDALEIASVGVIPALVGLIAYFRLPRGNALRIEALFAIAMGLAVAVGLILLMFL